MFDLVVCTRDGMPLKRFDLSRLKPGGQESGDQRVARVLIGRAEDCDIRIRCSSISRHHCAVEVDQDADWVIRDLGSTHGTVVEGVKISEAAVNAGLTVEIGPAVLRFERRLVAGDPGARQRSGRA